jgi:UDP-N-acetylglucosamine diphosphorylase/glucosamine-1-phosphate N-acetyltransferase
LTHLVVFEDEHHAAFEIVAPLRGVFDLRCGARTLLERVAPARGKGGALVLLARVALHDLVREAHPDAQVGAVADGDALFVNARLLALGDDLERLAKGPPGGFGRFAGGALVAARCDGAAATRLGALLAARIDATGAQEPIAAAFARACPDAARADAQDEWRAGSCLLEHAWDLVRHNGTALCDDFRRGPGAGVDAGALVYPGVHLLQDGAIRIGAGCRIKPGVVLDAEDGPITLADGVDVQPQVVVRGPAYIGAHTVLNAGARIHDGTSLGPVCKMGGEIAETVVQGYSNKQHDGFLGHAWLGEWVNLGAGTDTSDLKNNYSRVRMWEGGRMHDTGMQFLGLVAADHVKSAIGTAFNTGTVVGLASQIFGSGFPPKFVPPFSWGGAGALAVYDYRRAADTARVVMQRRGIAMSPAYERGLRRVFDARERWAAADDA